MIRHIILRSASAVDEGGITPARNEQASSDEQLQKLWLHGRGPNTQRAYRGDVARFLTFVAKPLPRFSAASSLLTTTGEPIAWSSM